MDGDTIKTNKQYGAWLATLNAKEVARKEYYAALLSRSPKREKAALEAYQESARAEEAAKRILWV